MKKKGGGAVLSKGANRCVNPVDREREALCVFLTASKSRTKRRRNKYKVTKKEDLALR